MGEELGLDQLADVMDRGRDLTFSEFKVFLFLKITGLSTTNRSMLEKRTGLSHPSVTNAIASLLDKGILREKHTEINPFRRNWALEGKCEQCGQPFPSLDEHHIIPLPEGADTLENVVYLCPNCHRLATMQNWKVWELA